MAMQGVSINEGIVGATATPTGWIERSTSGHLDHLRCDSLVLLDPAHVGKRICAPRRGAARARRPSHWLPRLGPDNNIGRQCYRIGQIQRELGRVLSELDTLASDGVKTHWPPAAADDDDAAQAHRREGLAVIERLLGGNLPRPG